MKLFAIFFLVAALPNPAHAGDKSEESVTYSFGDELVGGQTQSPLGDRVSHRDRLRATLLIRARRQFVPELQKSVENL